MNHIKILFKRIYFRFVVHNMNQSSKPTLFYSKRCPHCAEVLNKIRSAHPSVGDGIEFVLVDGNRNLPPFLREVPTVIVRGRPPMTGESVFMWVDTVIRTTPAQQQVATAPASASASVSNTMGGLGFYNSHDMSGFSDTYSFLDGSADIQEHCFVYLDENGNKQMKCVPPQQAPPQVQSGRYREEYSVNRGDPRQMTMSQQHNIRLQQQARQLPELQPFSDPTRARNTGESNKVSENDYEEFIRMRDSDPRIPPTAQRF